MRLAESRGEMAFDDWVPMRLLPAPAEHGTPLGDELAHRAREGHHPITVAALHDAFRAIGYRLDRTMDCRHNARWMTGSRAAHSYPSISTGISEADTGLSAFNVDARRDGNFARLQAMRVSGDFFAVSNGALLEP
ncbi:hypothetical protein [Sphingomonas oryzagri]